jgi:hypothetical protein
MLEWEIMAVSEDWETDFNIRKGLKYAWYQSVRQTLEGIELNFAHLQP